MVGRCRIMTTRSRVALLLSCLLLVVATPSWAAPLARTRFAFGSDPEWGIAVFAPGSRAEYVDGEFVLKTPDAATPLSFRTCASQEGVHFTTWRGNRRTWHEYVYLGSDLEATCTDKDVGE
jgi:hypothetical protein